MDTTRVAPQTFTQSLLAQIRTVEGQLFPVPAELSYDSSDPYAVTLRFHVVDAVVPWTFARDLLDDGLRQPTGDGDVHVWPGLSDEGHAVVTVELCSPEGGALVELAIAETADFVDACLELVPLGTEVGHLDLDTLIAALLVDQTA